MKSREICSLLTILLIGGTAFDAAPPSRHLSVGGDDPLPVGALLRIGTARLRHPGPVNSVCYSPAGNSLIVGLSIDGTTLPSIWLWDAKTGRFLRNFWRQLGGISRISLAPNGRTAVCTGMNGAVNLVDLVDRQQLHEFGNHRHTDVEGSVSDARLSPNGKVVAAARIDIAIYDTATGKLLRQFGKFENPAITSVAFSTDGKVLATSIGDNRLLFWDWATGKQLREIRHKPARHLSFAPKGADLAGVTHDRVIFVIDGRTGKLRWSTCKPARFETVAFSPDGKVVAAGGAEGELTLFAADTGNRIRSWQAHSVRTATATLAFRHDGKQLASGGADGVVRIWNPSTGQDVLPLVGHQQTVTEVVCSPDGNFVLSASLDNSVRLWGPRGGREVRCFLTPYIPKSLAFSANGAACAWLDAERPTWFRLREKDTRIAPGSPSSQSLALSPDGQTVICLGPAGSVDSWGPLSGKWTHLHSHSEPGWLGTECLLSTQGGVAAWKLGHDMLGIYFIPQHKECELRGGLPGSWDIFRMNAEGTVFLSYIFFDVKKDPVLSVCDMKSGIPRMSVQVSPKVKAGAFSRTGRQFALIENRRIRVYETASGSIVREHPTTGIVPTCVDFMSDSQGLITGNADSTLIVWDIHHWRGRKPSPGQLKGLWLKLASLKAETAYRTLWEMAAAGDDAVLFLQSCLHPVAPADGKRLKRLLADLEDDAFHVRQAASKDLEHLAYAAAEDLRQAVKTTASPEKRSRIQHLLKLLDATSQSPVYLQQVRAIELLEHLETKKAKQLLERIASGLPIAPITSEARAALNRLRLRADHPVPKSSVRGK